jgi:hypothetical protein
MGKGKRAIFGEVAKNTTFKLYSWEKPLVKAYIQLIRKMRLEYNKNINNSS